VFSTALITLDARTVQTPAEIRSASTLNLRMYNAFVVTTQRVAPCFGARLDFRFHGSTCSRSAAAANGARFLKIEDAHEYADGHANEKEKACRESQGDFVNCAEEGQRKGTH